MKFQLTGYKHLLVAGSQTTWIVYSGSTPDTKIAVAFRV